MTALDAWLDERFQVRMDEDEPRLREALGLDLPMMLLPLTVQPLVGSPERNRWEHSCDRCGAYRIGLAQVHRRAEVVAGPKGGATRRILVVLLGGLCADCMRGFGHDPDALPRSPFDDPDPEDSLAFAAMMLGSDGFAAAFGEQVEHAEHAVALGRERMRRRRKKPKRG